MSKKKGIAYAKLVVYSLALLLLLSLLAYIFLARDKISATVHYALNALKSSFS